MGYSLLIVCSVLALVATLMNLVAVKKIKYKNLCRIMSFLLCFTAMRYITLIVYGDSPSFLWLQQLRYFYFASSMGITMVTLCAIIYATPIYREKVSAAMTPVYFLPWNLFYLYVLIKQPTAIVKGQQFGYMLVLTGEFTFYLSVVQGSISVIIGVLCIIGLIKYKHLQIRVQLFFIIAAQFLLALDGVSYYFSGPRVFPPFTLTEAFALAATYYTFSHPIREIKKRT